jgi:hypothetical protein
VIGRHLGETSDDVEVVAAAINRLRALRNAALSRLIKEGPPPGLPVIPPAGAVPL